MLSELFNYMPFMPPGFDIATPYFYGLFFADWRLNNIHVVFREMGMAFAIVGNLPASQADNSMTVTAHLPVSIQEIPHVRRQENS